MNPFKTTIAAVGGLTVMAFAGQGQGLTLNFANNTGAPIVFNGSSDTFQFNTASSGPQAGYQWHVTTENGGGSAVGLLGSITGGPFSYGSISSTGSGITLIQTASVSGPIGNLVINDGAGFNLTGSVNLESVTTYSTTLGALNSGLLVNLTGVAYGGSNSDLIYLMAHQPGTLNLSFQFSPGQTLTTLSSGTGPYSTSYSGSLTVVPEPSVMAIAGLSGLGVLLLKRRNTEK